MDIYIPGENQLGDISSDSHLEESIEDKNHEVRFVEVEMKGKITLQAVVNNVKFYCNKTLNDGQRKKFRCSYYDSEKCKCSFFATRIDCSQMKSESE